MEKIREALRKAEEERGKKVPASAAAAAKAKGMNTAARLHVLPAPISYSHTKVIPVSEKVLRENRIVAGVPEHPQADTFRVLRTKILHKMRKDGLRSLGITSPTKGCGKSMIAANLAVALAMEKNQTVLLVDLDLRRPSIHRQFGLESTRGLVDYLMDEAELSDLLVNPAINRLVLLPAGRAFPQSSELLSTPRMMSLVEEVTSRYTGRIIIFDLPPLIGLDDALVLLPQLDAGLLVVEEAATSKEEISQSLHLLDGVTLLGVVYNKAQYVKSSPY